ncbi:MAG: hypothetical protein QF805_20575, partial [Pirellulaceae bacterium]|nr:hypothetical protein [Pirellulaceae bacterium]
MVFEHIEKLKQEYTDRYVVVDDTMPELARFRGHTGTVRTVNMSGRALVEFDSGDNNVGWFDIDIDYLKVIDEPLAKPEPAPKAKAKKEKAPSKLEEARGEKADKKAKPAGPSVEEMLAAARGEKGGAKTPAAKAPPAKTDKSDPSKMSVDDILASARGG